MPEHTITGGQLVVDMLKSFGVTHVYGVVGGQTLAITDAILTTPGIEFVHTRHENAAAVMADAHGRLTGRPAACIATTGPGATNLLTGVGGAFRDSSPAFVITCNNNGENIHKDDAQNADHVELFKPLTKFSRLIAHPSAIKTTMEEAYVNAVTGNPGPVHLDFARDTIEGPVAEPPTVADRHPVRDWVQRRPAPSPEAVADVVSRLSAAKKPVIWVGNGGNRGEASDAVLALAEAYRIPVVTTFNGIGAVPTDHPLVFGAVSRMGTALSTRVLEGADLVLALGNSLNAVSTTRWRRSLPTTVQVDVDPSQIARYYADVTVGVVADIREFVEAVLAAAPAQDGGEARTAWIDTLDHARDEWWQLSDVADPDATGELSPADIVRTAREASPDDTLLIPDAGNPGVWSFLWQITRPGTYIKPVGFGNMGFALPAAIAASLIDPERPVLALIGDGSLGMSLGELETLARVGGNVCIVVLNDSSYGNIRQEQELHFGGRTIGVDFTDVRFDQVATAMGVQGRRVDGLADLADGIRAAFEGGVPVVLDVPLSRDVSAWTYSAFIPFASEDE